LLRWHSGPEKAGVGGSIPSLATTCSITSKPPETPIYSNSFQLDLEDSPHPQDSDSFRTVITVQSSEFPKARFGSHPDGMSSFRNRSRLTSIAGPFLTVLRTSSENDGW